MRVALIVLLAVALVASAARAADVTEPQQPVNSKALEYFRLGVQRMLAKQWRPAIEAFTLATQYDTRFVEAYNNLGYCYRKVGEHQRSLDNYKTALALRPLFAPAHDYIARTYLAMGDRENALRHYEILRRIDAKRAAILWEAIRRDDPEYQAEPGEYANPSGP